MPQEVHTREQERAARFAELEAVMFRTPLEARQALTALLQEAREAGDVRGEAMALCLLAGSAFYLGEPRDTVMLSERALRLARHVGDVNLETRLLNGLALAHQRIGEYDQAFEYFLGSLRLAGEHHDDLGRFRALNNLANMYCTIGNIEQALSFQKEALGIATQLDGAVQQGSAITHMIAIHGQLGEHDEVLSLAAQHLDSLRAHCPARWTSSVLTDVSRSLLAQGRVQDSLDTALAERLVALERQDHESVAQLNLAAARAHHFQGRSDRAMPLLHEALALNREHGNRPLEIETLAQLSHLYELVGDQTQALKLVREQLALEQRIHAQEVETKSNLSTARVRVELLQREAELERVRNVELAQVNLALHEAQDILHHRATHDSLTGLANRLHFQHETQDTLNHLGPDEHAALIFIDLDKFKNVNDSFGHHTGDKLLQAVARHLTAAVRSTDLVGRMGGDEFTVLLRRLAHPQDVTVVARKILQALQRPLHLDGHDVEVNASVGWAVAPLDGQDAETLLQNADIAMYRVKHAGGGQVMHFEPVMGQDVHEHRQLERELRGAEERDELRLHYQARYEPDGTLVGFEALVRWQHPTRGLIPPDRFIPLAEDTRLILPIGAWVLREACRQAVAWGFERTHLCMSVNVSPMQFEQPDFAAQVTAALSESGLSGQHLILELTESLVMRDLDRARQHTADLKVTGIQLAIDDFGTGYSSLSVLHALPFDHLKIDRTFTRGLQSRAVNAGRVTQVMTAMITLAHNLNMHVTVEGVEEEQQLQLLRSLKCDHVQGYLLARPLPPRDAQHLIPDANPVPS